MTVKAASLSLSTQISYGAGQIAGQVFRDVPSLLLLFFMTNVLGINPALAGTAIFLPKLVGGITFDVTAGVLSDRWLGRIKRRQWLLAGALAAPVAMVALFHVPVGTDALRAGYVMAVFTLYMIAFASFSVPYLALAGDLALSSQARTVLMAWRLVFTSVGVLIAGALAPAYVAANGAGQVGYEKMAIVLGIACSLSLLLAWRGGGKAEAEVGLTNRGEEPPLTFSTAMTLLGSGRFAALTSITLVQLAGSGMSYAALLYFLTYNMARADAFQAIGVIVLLACVGIVIAQPIWVRLATKFGRERTYAAAAFIHALAYIGWGFSAGAGLGMIYAFALMLGIGNSGWSMLGNAMVADIAGRGKAGLVSAVWIANDKIGFALGGSLLIGLILSAYGFDTSRAVAGLSQSASAQTGILIAFSIVPALCNLLAALVFAKWSRSAPN